MQKLRRSFLWTAVLIAGAAVAFWWRAQHPSRSALKAQGEKLIAGVEQYRERHGEYPNSLADAEVAVPTHAYGPWRYERTDGYFWLSVGDYGRDGFVLSYDSSDREWHLDD